MVIFRERHEGDAEHFESALKKAKAGIHEACEIFEDMKEEFGERGGSYGERYSMRGGNYGEHGGYYGREWDEMPERRYRDSMGRYR